MVVCLWKYANDQMSMQSSFNEVPKVYNFIIKLETVCCLATYIFTYENSISFLSVWGVDEKVMGWILDGNQKIWQAPARRRRREHTMLGQIEFCRACKKYVKYYAEHVPYSVKPEGKNPTNV